MSKTLQIRLIKSVIGRKGDQKLWVRSLGLSKIGSTASVEDNGSTRGLLKRLSHCVVIDQ